MADPLTPERFRALAETYGGVVARWPEDARDAAAAMAREPWAGAVLCEAAALDAALDRWRVPAPAAGFADRVAATAPVAAWLWRGARLWWSGIAAAAALGGAAAGAAAAAAIAPPVAAAEASTAFGDLGGEATGS